MAKGQVKDAVVEQKIAKAVLEVTTVQKARCKAECLIASGLAAVAGKLKQAAAAVFEAATCTADYAKLRHSATEAGLCEAAAVKEAAERKLAVASRKLSAVEREAQRRFTGTDGMVVTDSAGKQTWPSPRKGTKKCTRSKH